MLSVLKYEYMIFSIIKFIHSQNIHCCNKYKKFFYSESSFDIFLSKTMRHNREKSVKFTETSANFTEKSVKFTE